MLTSKEIEEFIIQVKIRKGDFIIIQDTLLQNGYRFKKKNTSSNNCTAIEKYLIGKGSQSHVFLGEIIENGKEVAIKISNCSEEAYKEMINQLQILKQKSKHNFIVQVYDHFLLEEQQIQIQIVELCLKSLKDEINEMKLKEIQFSVDQIMEVFLFCINILCEIHSNNIIHLNIKPTNILLSKDGQYKIADFGVSKNAQLHNTNNSSIGQRTDFYLSPEQLQNIENVETEKELIKMKQSTDIYSMGITLLEILGVTLNMKIFNDLKSYNYSEIQKQINYDQHNFYIFLENFMLQQKEKNRYFAFRLRLQLMDYFESIFPFQEEQNRINQLIIIYEASTINKNNKYLAYLYFYMSSTILRNQDGSLIEKSLQIMKDFNLLETFDASIFYEHYSQILVNSQRYEESNKYLLLSYQIKISLFESAHLEIANNLLFQSNNARHLVNFQQMLDLQQKTLEILEIIFEKKDNPDIANVLNTIGKAYNLLGDSQKALNYKLKGLKMRETLFTGNHPNIAKSLNDVGNEYYDLGDAQKGLEYHLKALEMYQTLYTGNHPDIAMSLNNVGVAYNSNNDIQKGLEYYLKTLEMYQKLYSGNHPDIAMSLNNVGCAHDDLGQTQKGLEYHLTSLQMRQIIFKGNHPDIATSLSNIGAAYGRLGETSKRLKYHLIALQMYQALFSEKHPDVAWSLINVGNAYNHLDDKQNGLKYYQKALKMCSALLQENNVQVLQMRIGLLKQTI